MYKAVIFDIGGVVMRSPFLAIADYERSLELPVNYLNCSITGRGPQSAWAKFERGEIELTPFYEEFGRELSDVENGNIWYRAYCNRKGLDCPPLPDKLMVNGRELFQAMMRGSGQYDPHIRHAILCLRGNADQLIISAQVDIHGTQAAGRHKIIALTNNFGSIKISDKESAQLDWTEGPTPDHLRMLFDDFCDSSSLGMRKPELGFYLLACERNGIKPSEAVFLDDIRLNLKAAKELGMTTIQVVIGKSLDAMKELEKLVGLDLTGPLPESKL